MLDRLKGLLRRAGMDRAVFFGLLHRGSAAAFGALQIALIAWRMPTDVQGYHFTFLNLVLLQTFAELGLLTVTIQLASPLWASLRRTPEGGVEGDPDARSRLVSLGRLVFAWFFTAGVVVAVLVGAFGALFFAREGSGDVEWRGPWLALCVLSGLKMAYFPALGLLEGTQQVAELYFLRWISALASGVAFCAALLAGLGLWAGPAGAAAEFIWIAGRLLGKHRPFLRTFLERPAGARVSWARDVLPLQSRIALSWIAGWFAYSAFTPLLFAYDGPESAGRWGLSWSLYAFVAGVAGLWVTTRASSFGVWIARRDFAALDADFRRRLLLSLGIGAAGALAVWTAGWLLQRSGHPWASRVLPPELAWPLAAGSVLILLPLGQSVYLRAHGREPFLVLSLLQAGVTFGGSLVLGRAHGARGMAWAYLAGALAAVPLGAWIWRRCRRDWHA